MGRVEVETNEGDDDDTGTGTGRAAWSGVRMTDVKPPGGNGSGPTFQLCPWTCWNFMGTGSGLDVLVEAGLCLFLNLTCFMVDDSPGTGM